MKNFTKYNTRNVDTSKLEVGMFVKNYKKMCELLGEEEASNNGKKTQVENWGRFFEYIKDGHMFYITKIYDVPKPTKIDDLRKTLFASSGEYLLMNLLEDECTGEHSKPYYLIPRNKLYQELCLTNSRYNTLSNSRKELKIKLGVLGIVVTDDLLDTVFELCDKKCYNVLETILLSTKTKQLIKAEKIHMIDKGDGNGYVESAVEEYVDEETGEVKIINVDEDIIEDVETRVRLDYADRGLIDAPTMRQIINKRLIKSFYKQVNEVLFKEQKWVGCYKVFKLQIDNMDRWNAEQELYTEDISYYVNELTNNFRSKLRELTEKSKYELPTKIERQVADLLISYVLQNPIMTDEELQEQYAMIMNGEYTMDNTIGNTLTAPTTPTKKQKEEKSMSKTSKPTPTTTPEPTYTQPDYSDIPDDWEQIYESLEKEDRECEAAMRKLEEQEQSKHKPVNTEMFTAMFDAQGDAQAVDISNLLDFNEEKCEDSTDSAYASVQFGARAFKGDEYSWNDVDVVDRPDINYSEFDERDIKSMARSI